MLFKKSKEIEALTAEVNALKNQLSPEQNQVNVLRQQIAGLTQMRDGLNQTVMSLQAHVASLQSETARLNGLIVQQNEEILVQSFGLYEPRFAFINSEEYKQRLDQVREQQKQMIKAGTAASGNVNWQVDGSAAKGRKMVKDMQKLLLRAFNSECDDVVEHVKYNNYDQSVKRIMASYESISKLCAMMSIVISYPYLQLKLAEVSLALEYQKKKQDEKEEKKRILAEAREQAKVQKELEEARRSIMKEQMHYQKAYLNVVNQLKEGPGEEQEKVLLQKKEEMEAKLRELDAQLRDVDYRESNQKAGYVYVISNIGAFGENVYKIGMTRRLDPTDRVDELGDASVPFRFDIHAMIFSDNAPALETALHNAFADRKVNMVNSRKEFFHVTLDEIEAVVRANYDKAVEFERVPQAEQYRESLIIRQSKQ